MGKLVVLVYSTYLFFSIILFSAKGSTIIAQLLGMLSFGLFFADRLMFNKRFVFPMPVKIFGSFVIYILFWSLIQNNLGIENSMARFFTTFQIFLLFFLGVNLNIEKSNLKYTLNSFHLGIIYVLYDIYKSGEYVNSLIGGSRVSGLLENPNILGGFLAMGMYIAFLQFFIYKKVLVKWFYVFLSLFYTIPVFLISGSKAAIMLAVVSILSFVFLFYKKLALFKKAIFIPLFLFSFLTIFSLVRETSGVKRIILMANFLDKKSGKSTDHSTKVRAGFMTEGIRLWSERPLFGWGIKQFREINTVQKNYYPHNNYIVLLSNLGIIGFILYYSIHFVVIYKLYFIRMRLSKKEKEILLWLIFMIFPLFLQDFTKGTYWEKPYWIYMSIIIGVTFSYSSQRFKSLK